MIAGTAGMLIGGLLTPQQVADWGWRLPFIFGLTIVPASLYIRWSVPELDASAHRPARAPLREVASHHKLLLLLGMGAFTLVSVANYCLAFYLPTYAVHNLGLPPIGGFAGTLLIGAVQTLLSPFFGALSDRQGRMPVMIFAALGLAAATIPAFLIVVGHPGIGTLLLSQFVLGILVTAYQAPMPAFLCDLFPASLRATGVAIVARFHGDAGGRLHAVRGHAGDRSHRQQPCSGHLRRAGRRAQFRLHAGVSLTIAYRRGSVRTGEAVSPCGWLFVRTKPMGTEVGVPSPSYGRK